MTATTTAAPIAALPVRVPADLPFEAGIHAQTLAYANEAMGRYAEAGDRPRTRAAQRVADAATIGLARLGLRMHGPLTQHGETFWTVGR